MKKSLLFFAILFSTVAFAQVPQGISYQAIALNGSGNPVTSSNVGVRLSVLDNSASGTVLYTETQMKMTNPQGLFNLVIGQGNATFGTFAGINWSTNSKFIKIEMDLAGGTNYVLTGTTQLLSVPYALASDSLITSAGEGITLVSPNGTPYTLSVNDGGTLSLPTSGSASNFPANLYMYGTFNGYNAATALQTAIYTNFPSCSGACVITPHAGYKYLTAGTEIKFLSQNDQSSPVYGINGTNNLVVNGSSFTVVSNAFYYFNIQKSSGDNTIGINVQSISPMLKGQSGLTINATSYNVGTNTFSYVLADVTTTSNNRMFTFSIPYPWYMFSNDFGDNLSDGSIDMGGNTINLPNVTTTPKNFRVDLVINFNGSGNYTITQI